MNVFGEFFGSKFSIFLTLRANDDDFSGLEDHDGTLGFGFPDNESGESFFIEPGVLDFLSKVFEVDFFFNRHFAVRDYILDDGSLTGHWICEMTRNNVYNRES